MQTVRVITSCIMVLMGLVELTGAASEARAGDATVCEIHDMRSLHDCFDHADAHGVFSLTQDVTCGSAGDCCPDGHAPIMLDVRNNKVIDGNGHIFRRTLDQKACSAVTIRRSAATTIRNLTIDESAAVPPCNVNERGCPATIDIADAKNQNLENVSIFDGKGYVVKVWATDGFTFDHSAIIGAGIIGLYVGHYKYGPSSNVAITNSTFVRARTNAVAIQGVVGTVGHPTLVTNNLFVDNHWHGLFPIPGGVTTGGQLLLDDGSNFEIANNVFSTHGCDICLRNKSVIAVELGDAERGAPGVSGAVIENNVALNPVTGGIAIHRNANAPVFVMTMRANRVAGYGGVEDVGAAGTAAGNRLEPAARPSVDQGRYADAPQPGQPIMPVFACAAGAQRFVSMQRTCEGRGKIDAVLGFETR